MEEKTITLTETELQGRIDEAVNTAIEKATKDLTSKHNGEMASARKRIKELENANLSQDEIEARAKKEALEESEQELNELRAYKKGKILEERIAKEGLPNHFKYDSRLLNASEEDFPKVLKSVKAEYEETLPKGNAHSSVIQTQSVQASKGKSEKEVAYEKGAEALEDLFIQ